jgi:hypothetical protein
VTENTAQLVKGGKRQWLAPVSEKSKNNSGLKAPVVPKSTMILTMLFS